MKGLDVKKLLNENLYVIVSSKEALKDVIPIQWAEDVLNGERNVVVKSATN